MTRTVAFVFPGQGSQRVGMLDGVLPAEDIERLLDAAEALTGLELASIARNGPDDALADTLAAQPLLYLVGWAWASALDAAGITPVAVAGHSLGEFAALAYAGVFSVEAGLELVCERARLMAEAAASTPGAMVAVIGMEREEVASLVEHLHGVWLANDNAPGQVVLTGTHDGIERATAALHEAGARKVVPLKVAGPFHSPLMAPAAERFAATLRAAEFADAEVPVVQNSCPVPTLDAETIRERLIAQMTSPVRWAETMEALRSLGADTLVETGPGAVLTGLARRTEGLDAMAVETVGVERLLEVLAS